MRKNIKYLWFWVCPFNQITGCKDVSVGYGKEIMEVGMQGNATMDISAGNIMEILRK